MRYKHYASNSERKWVLLVSGVICGIMGVIMLVIARDPEYADMGMIGLVMFVFAAIFLLGALIAAVVDGDLDRIWWAIQEKKAEKAAARKARREKKAQSTAPRQDRPVKAGQDQAPQLLRIRGQLDLELIPQIFFRDEKTFSQLMLIAGGELPAKLFNDIYEQVEALEGTPMSHYTKDDFKCFPKLLGNTAMQYIELPPCLDASDSWATAYVVTIRPQEARFFVVERIPSGRCHICEIDRHGHPTRYGPAPEGREAILERIGQILELG